MPTPSLMCKRSFGKLSSSCEEAVESKSTRLDVLCGAIEVSCVRLEQSPSEDKLPCAADNVGGVISNLSAEEKGAADEGGFVISDDNEQYPDEYPPPLRFPAMPSNNTGSVESDWYKLPPPVIVESSSLMLGLSNVADHRLFVLEFERLDIIDMVYSKFSHLPGSRFETIAGTKISQFSLGRQYSLLFENAQWNTFLDTFKVKGKSNSLLHQLDHLDFNEVYVTALCNHGTMAKPQRPHVDYSWEVLLLGSRRRRTTAIGRDTNVGLKFGCMPFTMHMPLTPAGSYLYIWFGPGLSCPIYIRYGHVLCLRGDVVHCGGLPPVEDGITHDGMKYERLHFYFLTNAADLPDNSIFCDNYDGVSFVKDHFHHRLIQSE